MNAVYELITRDRPFPPARAVYRVGVAGGLLVTILMTWEILNRWPRYPLIGAAIYDTISVVVLLLPALIAAVSAVITARHARRIDWAALSATPIIRSDVMWGFVRGALFQCRVIIAITLALLPIIPLGWLEDRIEHIYYYSTCSWECYEDLRMNDYPAFSDSDIEKSLAYWTIALLTCASSVAAASIGTFFGLNSRSPVFSLPLAVLVTLICVGYPSLMIIYSGTAGIFETLQRLIQIVGIAVLNIVGFGLYVAARDITLKRFLRLPA